MLTDYIHTEYSRGITKQVCDWTIYSIAVNEHVGINDRYMTTYKIVRFYNDDRRNRTVMTGLSLKEARAWCEDPETSSKTAENSSIKGEWFEGFTIESMPSI